MLTKIPLILALVLLIGAAFLTSRSPSDPQELYRQFWVQQTGVECTHNRTPNGNIHQLHCGDQLIEDTVFNDKIERIR